MEINNYEYTDSDSSWRVLIRYATVQTKLNDTPNTQYNKNVSQKRLYYYTGLEIALNDSL